MARLKATCSYEYDADPINYGGPNVSADTMASIDQEGLGINPEMMLEQADLQVRVEVVCE